MGADLDADILIIGSGAGGGTLARALAPSGLSILVLERGDYLPREKENWDASSVFRTHRYHTDEHWYDRTNEPFSPITGYQVGGNTKFYGAALLRRRVQDFESRTHVDGTTPAWPLKYDDFAPYYDQAESWYFVHGTTGLDPNEPPRLAYPYPALMQEPRMEAIRLALLKQGLHPFPLPMALNRNETDPRQSPCIRCDTCDGFPCLLHAKGDAETCGITPALAYPNVTLLTRTRVLRLLSSKGRHLTGVEAQGPDGPRCFRAKMYVLAAGAIHSAALLLQSACDAAPQGLANRSDQVGRNYMCHLNSACIALDPRKANPTLFQKTLAINDFYDDSRNPGFPFPLGHIQNLGKVTPAILHAQRPRLPSALCTWIARHSVDWWLTTEDLPHPDNRVILKPDGHIQLCYRPSNEEAHLRLLVQWKKILRQLGFIGVFFERMGIGAVAHQVGTLRFGDHPEQSVLNRDCRTHDIDNLYVADASFMPSISAVNPSLTIMANALRIASHLRQKAAEGL
ncbi:MAG: GMC family oxidoreductase [Pseudomonadota bacterium]|nr:GMC family oxidoreductase [Pseudomonadota bacterium]